jgi:hypothetical protein
MSKTALARIAFGLGSIALALSSVVSANAVTAVTKIAWVQNLEGGGYGIFSGAEGDSAVSMITEDTAAGHTSRALTTDGSYLYFADNQTGQQWQLVRTELDGSNRLLLAQLTSEPVDLVVTGVSIYFSASNSGLHRASSLALSTPVEIIGDTHDAGLGGSLPGYDYGAFAIGNGKVVMDCGSRGLLIADLGFSGASNGSVSTDAGYLALGVRDIVYSNNNFYFSGSNFTGIKMTNDPSTVHSGWAAVNTYVPIDDSEKVSSMFVLGSDLYYTTGTGYVLKWEGMNPQDVSVSEALEIRSGTENFGLAVFQSELPEELPELANTGLDPMMVLAGLGMVVVGFSFRKLAK